MNKKESLKKEIRDHRNAIDYQVEYYKETGRKIGLMAVAAGGAFFLAYSIARGISAGKKDRVQYVPEEGAQSPVYAAPPSPPRKSSIGKKIGSIILSEVGVLLIGLAKKQIKNYISNLDLQDDEEDTK